MHVNEINAAPGQQSSEPKEASDRLPQLTRPRRIPRRHRDESDIGAICDARQ
jgi:hypothetical protein